MSTHARQSVQHLLKVTPLRSTKCTHSSNLLRHLRRRYASSSSTQTGEQTPSTSLPSVSRPHEEPQPQSKATRRGFRIPALALFAGGFLLALYQQRSNANASDPSSTPHPFTKYALTAKEDVSSTAAILTFTPSKPSKASIDLDDPELERAITSLEFKQPQLQIARSYTPLPEIPGQRLEDLRFLIRRDGEVSKYLHRLDVATGGQVEMRGLYSEYMIPENMGSVVFIAAGTGIAPAMRVASVLEGEARVHVLWANRRREECAGGVNDTEVKKRGWQSWWSSSSASTRKQGSSEGSPQSSLPAQPNLVVAQLQQLQRRAKAAQSPETTTSSPLLVDYFVDEESTLITAAHIRAALRAAADSSSRQLEAPQSSPPAVPTTPKKNLLFISGPDGFIAHWAGPKVWGPSGVQEQGPLGGVLGSMNNGELAGWSVVKL